MSKINIGNECYDCEELAKTIGQEILYLESKVSELEKATINVSHRGYKIYREMLANRRVIHSWLIIHHLNQLQITRNINA